MTPRTRKLLTAAALATAFIAGPAAAHGVHQNATQARAAAAAAPVAATAAATEGTGRSIVATILGRADAAAKAVLAGKTSCRIGNGKSSMYSDNLYECVTVADRDGHVIFTTSAAKVR